MSRCLAFVLGGGGARGALQVGALRVLFEAGLRPDLLVGTSIGAVNATGLAMWGLNAAGLERLEQAYQLVTESRLMDPRRFARFAMGAISNRPSQRASRRVREHLIAAGITPDLRFADLTSVRLAVVGADLHTGQTVVYGDDPQESVLEGVMASTSIQPWFSPIKRRGHWVVDGGALSCLPIEPALSLGATEIIALDLNDPKGLLTFEHLNGGVVGEYLEKLFFAVMERQTCMETALASARGVRVHYVSLRSTTPVAAWDFKKHRDLFKVGYDTMRAQLGSWMLAGELEAALSA